MTNNLNNDVFYKVALFFLNQEFRNTIESSHQTLKDLDEATIKSIQSQINESYLEQDRYKVYHITKVRNQDYNRLEQAISNPGFNFDFLIKPSFSDWSIEGKKKSANDFLFYFSKFTQKSIKNPDEEDAVENPQIRVPHFFQFVAHFSKVDEIDIVVISFHAYRPTPYGTYEFDQEINYFYEWVMNFGLELEKIDYKEIFDALDQAKFDKCGFKGEDLRSENDLVKAIFKLKHNKRNEHSDEMHRAIDHLIGPEISDLLLSGILEVLPNGDASTDELVEKKLRVFLGNFEFSRKFFSSIQKGCDHGIGYVRHTGSNNVLFEYNLEYTQTGEGLIRSRTEKWLSFEPLYNEIIRYLKTI